VHDIVDLETRGIPSMFIASSKFRQAAIAQSVALGMPNVQRMFVPHPIQDRTDAEMADYADQAFEEILGMITAVDTTH
jgi:hypothetical protein